MPETVRMNIAAAITAAGALVLTALAPSPVAAQDRGNSGWSFRLAPYIWFSNIGGAVDLGLPADDQRVGDLIVPVEDTVLQNDWAIRAEIGKGRVRGWFNVSLGGIANEVEMILDADPVDTLPGTYDLEWFTTEAFAAVQVGSFSRANSFEVYGGGRYMRHRQTVTLEGGSPTTITESWIDPVIGGRLYAEMGRRFWAAFNSDIGGFGVGSKFTWTLGGELGVRVFGPLDLAMRYNYQEVEYDNGKEGAERYEWSNGVQQGWFFGLVLKL
jgi:hypothetical protein